MGRSAPWARVAWFCSGLVASIWIALVVEHCPAHRMAAPPCPCAAQHHEPGVDGVADGPATWTLYLRSGQPDAVVRLHRGALELAHVSPCGKLHRIGLRSHDVITAIDGTPVGSIDALHHRLGRAFTTGSVQLELVRHGRVFRFTTDLRNPVLLRP